MQNFLPITSGRQSLVETQNDTGSLFDEEGEGMVGFEMDAARRAALERQRDDPRGSEGRLSRELEEGFMDDSDDEPSDDEPSNDSPPRGQQRGR